MDLLRDRRAKLVVNYVLGNQRLESFDAVVDAFNRAKRKLISFLSYAQQLHRAVLPSKKNIYFALPSRLREQVVEYEGLYFLRDIRSVVIDKIDVARDLVRDSELAKVVRDVFEIVYNKPLVRADSLNEDGLGYLEELNIVGIVRRYDRELSAFPIYNRELGRDVIRALRLLSSPLKSQPIEAIGIRLSIPRPTIPQIHIHQSKLLFEIEEKVESEKIERVNFLPMIRNFLLGYRVTNFRKLEKDVAQLFVALGYSFGWLEYGAFVHLVSRRHVPENIIIQATKRKFPTRKTLSYLRSKYGIRGSTAAVFICPVHVGEEYHRRFFPDWHVVFYDPSKKTWWYRTKMR